MILNDILWFLYVILTNEKYIFGDIVEKKVMKMELKMKLMRILKKVNVIIFM